MAKRGPSQDSPALTSLKGGKGAGRKRKPRTRAEDSAKPITAGSPSMPKWKGFGPEAQAEWKRIVAVMEARGTLTPDNRQILINYCLNAAKVKRMAATIQREGDFITAPSGYSQAHPALALMKQAEDACHKFGNSLGITPDKRDDIPTAVTKSEADEFDEWEEEYA